LLVLTVGQKAQIESVVCLHVQVYLKAGANTAEDGTAELENYLVEQSTVRARRAADMDKLRGV
jgi:hypothetical protein